MRRINIGFVMIVGGSLVAGFARAQDTNPPLTKIEIFENRTGTVIVRAACSSIRCRRTRGRFPVRAKESVEPGSGRKVYGIAVDLQEGGRPEDTTMVDYDELDSFLNGIDYISKANHTMTSLPDYDVGLYNGRLAATRYLHQRQPARHDTNRSAEPSHQLESDIAFVGTSWPRFRT